MKNNNREILKAFLNIDKKKINQLTGNYYHVYYTEKEENKIQLCKIKNPKSDCNTEGFLPYFEGIETLFPPEQSNIEIEMGLMKFEQLVYIGWGITPEEQKNYNIEKAP